MPLGPHIGQTLGPTCPGQPVEARGCGHVAGEWGGPSYPGGPLRWAFKAAHGGVVLRVLSPRPHSCWLRFSTLSSHFSKNHLQKHILTDIPNHSPGNQ